MGAMYKYKTMHFLLLSKRFIDAKCCSSRAKKSEKQNPRSTTVHVRDARAPRRYRGPKLRAQGKQSRPSDDEGTTRPVAIAHGRFAGSCGTIDAPFDLPLKKPISTVAARERFESSTCSCRALGSPPAGCSSLDSPDTCVGPLQASARAECVRVWTTSDGARLRLNALCEGTPCANRGSGAAAATTTTATTTRNVRRKICSGYQPAPQPSRAIIYARRAFPLLLLLLLFGSSSCSPVLRCPLHLVSPGTSTRRGTARAPTRTAYRPPPASVSRSPTRWDVLTVHRVQTARGPTACAALLRLVRARSGR